MSFMLNGMELLIAHQGANKAMKGFCYEVIFFCNVYMSSHVTGVMVVIPVVCGNKDSNFDGLQESQ